VRAVGNRLLPLVAGGVAVVAAALLWPRRERPAPGPPEDRPSVATLVDRIEAEDAGALPLLVERGEAGIAELVARLTRPGDGSFQIWPPRRDPDPLLIGALTAFGKRAEPALLQALAARPSNVRAVARAFASLGCDSEEVVAALLPHLAREEVADALVVAGPGAIPGLAEALGDEARCRGAARALSRLGAFDWLRRFLSTGADWRVRAIVAGMLADPGSREALSALVNDEEDFDVLRAACESLLKLGPSEYAPLLDRARLLTFNQAALFEAAANVRGVDFLVLAARDAGMQAGAFRAFDWIGAPMPREAALLAKAALGGGPARGDAAGALGEGCDDPEVPPMLLALAREDGDTLVRVAAAEAYARLGGDASLVIPILVQALPHKAHLHHLVGTAKRNAASRVLGTLGAPAVPALVEALDTDDDFAREQAVKALHDIGRPVAAAEGRLRELASSGKPGVSEAAQGLLALLGP